MKEYLTPIALAGIGVALLVHHKHQEVATDVRPLVPKTFSRSWKSKSLYHEGVTANGSASDFENSRPQKKTPSIKAAFSPSANKSGSFDKPYIFFQEKLSSLNNCLVTRTCQIPVKGPKDYDASIYFDMLATLKTLAAWQARFKHQDERIPELMGDFLPIENAYLKIEALKILGTQMPEPENLDIVLDGALRYPQPEVIRFAVKELARYQAPEQRSRIDEATAQVLLHGGVNAAIELAKEIKPLLTTSNRGRYQGLLKQLEQTPLSEEIAEELKESLN